MRTTHELKIWPDFFQAVLNGKMKFQLRRNDRDYQVGDQLLLKEWNPEPTQSCVKQGYTGREVLVRVDYIMDSLTLDRLMENPMRGIGLSGYIIMSVSLLP